jgi:hypothetical protein
MRTGCWLILCAFVLVPVAAGSVFRHRAYVLPL